MIRSFDSFPLGQYYEDMDRELSTTTFFQEIERKVRELFRLQSRQPIRNRFDLTDVIQEVNAQICRHANDDAGISHFLDTAWLKKVATGHFCKMQRLNLAKKRSVADEESHDMELVPGKAKATERLEMEEQAKLLLNCLEKLDVDTRHAIVRKNYDNATIKEIAFELNTTVYGAKSIYDDGVARLQVLMGSRIRQ